MKKPALLSTLLLSFYTTQASANPGAWVQPVGELQVINTFSYYHSDERFNQLGDKVPQPTYTKLEYNPYIEYGLWDHTTIGANLFLQQARSQGDSNFGLSDAEFFARTRLWQNDKYVISVQPMVKIPGLFDDTDQPTIGSDDPDIGLSALAGYNFELFNRKHYAEAEVGYRHRLGTPEDQFRFSSTVGFTVAPQWQILAQQFTTLSTDSVKGSTFTQSSRDDYDLLKLQLSGLYHYDEQLAFQLGGFYNIAGRNVGNGVGAIFGVWTRF